MLDVYLTFAFTARQMSEKDIPTKPDQPVNIVDKDEIDLLLDEQMAEMEKSAEHEISSIASQEQSGKPAGTRARSPSVERPVRPELSQPEPQPQVITVGTYEIVKNSNTGM